MFLERMKDAEPWPGGAEERKDRREVLKGVVRIGLSGGEWA